MEPLMETCHNLSPVTENESQQRDAAIISRVLAAQPPHAAHLARYASTARIDTALVYNRETDAVEERQCVTVTCFEKGEME